MRVDKIECSSREFGYKDMTEECGPNVNDAPSHKMKEAIFKHIPIAEGYAADFRQRHGIEFITPEQAARQHPSTQLALFA